MELSEKQLAANRANALKSTGPKTPGGKRNSSQNRNSRNSVARIILLPGESLSRLLQVVRSLTNEYEPQSATDFFMLDIMVVARWRIHRLWSVETAAITREEEAQAKCTPAKSPRVQATLAYQSLAQPPRSQESFSRQEARHQRQFYRAAEYLLRSKARREEMSRQSHQLQQNNGNSPIHEPIQILHEASTNPLRTLPEAPSNPPSDFPLPEAA